MLQTRGGQLQLAGATVLIRTSRAPAAAVLPPCANTHRMRIGRSSGLAGVHPAFYRGPGLGRDTTKGPVGLGLSGIGPSGLGPWDSHLGCWHGGYAAVQQLSLPPTQALVLVTEKSAAGQCQDP